MNNKQIADVLREIGACFEISDSNRFRSRAYFRSADTIEHLSEDLNYLFEKGKLNQIPTIGTNIAGYLAELLKNKQVKHFNAVKKKFPDAFFAFLKLPGFGSKTAFKLAKELKIHNGQNALIELKKAAFNHKISKIEGFGEKSEAGILQAIELFRLKQGEGKGILFIRAQNIADNIISYLTKSKYVEDASILGSLRRKKAIVEDIDIAVASDEPAYVIEHFIQNPQVARIVEKGTVAATVVLKSNYQVDLMVEPPQSFGALLQHFTGSKQHNIKLREIALKKGLSLSEHGIKKLKTQNSKLKIFSEEKGFYAEVGLEWIPPELREDRGEVEAAQRKTLPKLVTLSDIKGDLHIHSNYDTKPSHDLGENSLSEIIIKAQTKKYSYIGISDHNPSKKNTHDQIIQLIKVRKSIIDKLNYSTNSTRVNIINLLEIDILTDGTLALPTEAYKYIDAAIISVHSSFSMNEIDMTKRVLSGLSYPKVKIFGHPSARKLGEREQIKLDWQAVFDFCKKRNIALEINSNPYRLDLPDDLIKKAIDNGNKLVISSDAHSIPDMDFIDYGVNQARRGWAQKYAILNTLDYKDFNKWVLN